MAVQANVANASGDLRLDLPPGWKVEPRSQSFQIAMSGEQQQLDFTVTPPAGESTASLRAVATVGGREIASGMELIEYPHIPTQALFPPSDLKLVRANIQVTAHKIGYIMGAGDEMPDALRQLGLDVTLLSQSDLEQGDLSRFDAIVAGIRAYNVRAGCEGEPAATDGVRAQRRHVRGAVPERRGRPRRARRTEPGRAFPQSNIGPYPITIPGGNSYRVTVEEAPVTFPHPDSPLLAEAEPDHAERFRRLGAGARPPVRHQVGSAI